MKRAGVNTADLDELRSKGNTMYVHSVNQMADKHSKEILMQMRTDEVNAKKEWDALLPDAQYVWRGVTYTKH